jgi:hypothetical protein
MVVSCLLAYRLLGLVQYKRSVGTSLACEPPNIAFGRDAPKALRPQLYDMHQGKK